MPAHDLTRVFPLFYPSSPRPQAHAMPTLMLFKSTAGGPDHVADVLLRGIGRSVIIDQGYYPLVWRLPLRLLDVGLFAEIMSRIGPYVSDYQMLKAASAAKKAAGATVPAAAAKPGAPKMATPGRRRKSVAAASAAS